MAEIIRDLRYGSYRGLEGPYYLGDVPAPLATPESPTLDKWVSVIGVTEGPYYNAVNGYDSCTISIGIPQLCESFWLSSRLLVHVARAGYTDGAWEYLRTMLRARGWRMRPDMPRTGCPWVDATGGAPRSPGDVWGHPGTPERSESVRALVDLWDYSEAQQLQLEFIRWQLPRFIPQDVAWFFAGDARDAEHECARAGMVSFLLNNPRQCMRNLAALRRRAESVDPFAIRHGASPSSAVPDYRGWAGEWLQYQADHGLDIWPERWERVRPELERLWPEVGL